jgi:penicillin-binding protein 1C
MKRLWSNPKRRVLLAIALVAVAATTALARLPVLDVLGYTQVRASYRSSETTLLDRHGDVLHVSRSDFTGRRLSWAGLDTVSPALVQNVLTAEDRRFYWHGGVDFIAMLGSATALFRFNRPRGASTITMQLSGHLNPGIAPRSGGRSLTQKWLQMRTAWALERSWTKAQILETYLNLITYRSELKGVSAASEVLFGKDPSGLDNFESSILAALIRAPNAPKKTVLRRACALLNGSCGELDLLIKDALTPPFQFKRQQADAYHVHHRLSMLAPDLGSISSTLDAGLQHFVQQTVQGHVLGLADQNLRDAAVIVVDNASGDILSYVGSSGALSAAEFVDGVRARRQAGSTLKPFIYGLAIERKYLTAATLLNDAPIEIPIAAGGVYRPRNYDSIFHGPVTVREALASSLNTPAVRAILTVGPDEAVLRLKALGLNNLMAPEFYGASLALGSADVTLWEMSNAYRTLANGGLTSPLVLRPEKKAASQRVMSEGGAYIVTSILSDRAARALGFGLDSALGTPYFTAVKTGTSKDMRDNWCIGFSRDYTVGVWAGNFSGQPMWNVSGVSGAAPIWRAVMDHLHKNRPSHMPPKPKAIKDQYVTISTTGKSYLEHFMPGTHQVLAEVSPESRPHITYPTADTILAVDPDIPVDVQKIVFKATGAEVHALSWRLNDNALGIADKPIHWNPQPGQYQLSLVTQTGKTVDSIQFSVR